MKTVRGLRFDIVRSGSISCLSALGLMVSGCAVGGKSFAIDSNSRVPFFGLELKERKPKSDLPTFNSISRSSNDLARLEPAIQSGFNKSKWAGKKQDHRVTAINDNDQTQPSFGQGSISPKGNESAAKLSIAIQTTDVPKDVNIRTSSAAVIDFH